MVEALKPVPEAAVGAVRDTLSEAGSPLVGGMSYLHAKTAEKVLTVQLLREKLRRENERLTERLRKAEIIIEVQKKVAALLGRPLPAPDPDEVIAEGDDVRAVACRIGVSEGLAALYIAAGLLYRRVGKG